MRATFFRGALSVSVHVRRSLALAGRRLQMLPDPAALPAQGTRGRAGLSFAKRALSAAGLAVLAGCTVLHEPMEEANPIAALRATGEMRTVGACLERALRADDPGGHYAFHAEAAQGTIETDGWALILRQETPTSVRVAIKSALTAMGEPKRPPGLSFMIAQCSRG